ncbi:MAG: hypothetical protein U0869_07100 [Chloroflexota bacterium]
MLLIDGALHQAELSVTLGPSRSSTRRRCWRTAGPRRGDGLHDRHAVQEAEAGHAREFLGWGCIHLPEIELQTTASRLALVEAADGRQRDELDVALVAAGKALQTVASVLLMSDPHDLGMTAQVRSPHAERPAVPLGCVPGGGLSQRLFERTWMKPLIGARRSWRDATAMRLARPAGLHGDGGAGGCSPRASCAR